MAVRIVPESVEAWEPAARAIARGDLVVFPTDTVYGVGCDPYDVKALERVYVAKGRPQHKAIPLLLADVTILESVSSGQGQTAKALAEAFWPGALTLVVHRSQDLPAQLGSGDTIAVRVPDHGGLRHFIASCGGALAVTSANRSGEPDAVDVTQAAAYLGEDVSLYIDGGRSPGGRPSSVVDCTGASIKVLREGAISARQLQDVVDRAGSR